MVDFATLFTQIPVNAYVVVGCLIAGWLMKKYMPTDNKIIPTVMVFLGILLLILLEGVSVENIIIGALSGAASTGFHQVFAQHIEGTKDRDEILTEEVHNDVKY